MTKRKWLILTVLFAVMTLSGCFFLQTYLGLFLHLFGFAGYGLSIYKFMLWQENKNA